MLRSSNPGVPTDSSQNRTQRYRPSSTVIATMPRRETPRIPQAQAVTITTQTSSPDSSVRLATAKVMAAADVDQPSAARPREVQGEQAQHRHLQVVIDGERFAHERRETCGGP